jgi:hypothetical protein
MSQVSTEFLGNVVNLISSIGGPFSRTVDALTVNFNPMTDVEVWVDGIQIQVKSFLYDAATTTYQLYLGISLTTDNVVQVIHHMPNPPFTVSPYLAVDNSGTFIYAMISSVPQLIEVLDSIESRLYGFAVVCGVPKVLSYLEITEFGPFVYADVDGTLQPIGVYL